MKRLISLCLALLLLVPAALLPALAEASPATEAPEAEIPDLTVTLEALGLSITLPGDLLIYTREGLSDQADTLKALNQSPESMSQLMESRNIYLDALDPLQRFEIVAVMNEVSDVPDFTALKDEEILAQKSDFEAVYQEKGVTMESLEIYSNDFAKYCVIYISQPNGAQGLIHGLQYYTVRGGKAISLTLQSYAGPIDEAMESFQKSVVDNVEFE